MAMLIKQEDYYDNYISNMTKFLTIYTPYIIKSEFE